MCSTNRLSIGKKRNIHNSISKNEILLCIQYFIRVVDVFNVNHYIFPHHRPISKSVGLWRMDNRCQWFASGTSTRGTTIYIACQDFLSVLVRKHNTCCFLHQHTFCRSIRTYRYVSFLDYHILHLSTISKQSTFHHRTPSVGNLWFRHCSCVMFHLFR